MRATDAESYLLRYRRRGLAKFKLNPRYPHHRSDGLTRRRNSASHLQPLIGPAPLDQLFMLLYDIPLPRETRPPAKRTRQGKPRLGRPRGLMTYSEYDLQVAARLEKARA